MAGRIDSTVLENVQLLTTELVSNCVQHGNAGPKSEIQLGFSTPDGVVRVEVTDSGDGFELEMPVADPTTPGGFGLLIVDSGASRWGVSRDGRCVWFEVPRNA
jgi:anti-sigma regulatory factor (Ser/Thr protein kinase)